MFILQITLVVVAVLVGIGAIVVGCLLVRYLWTPDNVLSALPGLCVAIILGGGLIWVGLYYLSEFRGDTLARELRETSACTAVDARYGLIIDAGSTGSRIYIFCWKRAGANGIPWVKAAPELGGEPHWNRDIEPGLSFYGEDPKGDPKKAGPSLEPLINYALAKIGKDPQTLGRTSLYLMATAGMRQLSESNPERSEQILQSVRRYLKSTPFNNVSIQVISGQQEGLFGWIAVNYLRGSLKDENPLPAIGTTIGTLELGGASTQITFVPPDFARHESIPLPFVPLGFSQRHLLPLQWGETTYQIYSHSFDLGQKRAIEKVNSAACYPKGYPVSNDDKIKGLAPFSGDGKERYDACQEAIREMLRKTCTGKESSKEAGEPVGRPCGLKLCKKEVRDCSSVEEHPPPVSGVAFLAWANYYYIQDFFKVGQSYSLRKLEDAGRKYCSLDRDQIKKDNPNIREEYLEKYCFSSAYIPILLHEGYGFSAETQQITTATSLHDNEISWTLGAMVYIAMQREKFLTLIDPRALEQLALQGTDTVGQPWGSRHHILIVS